MELCDFVISLEIVDGDIRHASKLSDVVFEVWRSGMLVSRPVFRYEQNFSYKMIG